MFEAILESDLYTQVGVVITILTVTVFITSPLWGDLAEGTRDEHEFTWWLLPLRLVYEAAVSLSRYQLNRWERALLIAGIIFGAVIAFLLAGLLIPVGILHRLGRAANECFGPRKPVLPYEGTEWAPEKMEEAQQ